MEFTLIALTLALAFTASVYGSSDQLNRVNELRRNGDDSREGAQYSDYVPVELDSNQREQRNIDDYLMKNLRFRSLRDLLIVDSQNKLKDEQHIQPISISKKSSHHQKRQDESIERLIRMLRNMELKEKHVKLPSLRFGRK